MDELNEAGLGQPIRVGDHLVDLDILAELGQRGAEDVDVVTEVGISEVVPVFSASGSRCTLARGSEGRRWRRDGGSR